MREGLVDGFPARLIVTGGAGFIGSTFARRILARRPSVQVTVLDKLTYAGNPENVADLHANPRFRFVQGDICDTALVDQLAAEADAIVNFAAETHVDRSIESPDAFIQTDVYGTHVLIGAALRHRHVRYLQVSTDEVYGSTEHDAFSEESPLAPRSPYSASKAGGDLLVQAYHTTYGLPACITRGSNTFGPFQYPEKVIPLFVTNALDDEPLPLYGDGLHVRDWLYVEDHAAAIEMVLEHGLPGEVYNVGGGTEMPNLELTRHILRVLDKPSSLIRHVPDRAAHDRRYALDTSKITELGWTPERDFAEALAETVAWYRDHEDWWRPLKSGDYLEYYRRQYGARLAASSAAD